MLSYAYLYPNGTLSACPLITDDSFMLMNLFEFRYLQLSAVVWLGISAYIISLLVLLSFSCSMCWGLVEPKKSKKPEERRLVDCAAQASETEKLSTPSYISTDEKHIKKFKKAFAGYVSVFAIVCAVTNAWTIPRVGNASWAYDQKIYIAVASAIITALIWYFPFSWNDHLRPGTNTPKGLKHNIQSVLLTRLSIGLLANITFSIAGLWLPQVECPPYSMDLPFLPTFDLLTAVIFGIVALWKGNHLYITFSVTSVATLALCISVEVIASFIIGV